MLHISTQFLQLYPDSSSSSHFKTILEKQVIAFRKPLFEKISQYLKMAHEILSSIQVKS